MSYFEVDTAKLKITGKAIYTFYTEVYLNKQF